MQSPVTKTKKPQTMAELLASYKSPFPVIKKREIIKGKITKLTLSEILVDIQGKTEALVLEKDKKILHTILSTLHIGDEVQVSVLNPESDFGYPVVSLRRFIDDIVWKKLEDLKKRGERLEVVVDESIKGGFLVHGDIGISGFLPQSHVNFAQRDILGKKIEVSIIDLSKINHKVIFSQKKILDDKQFDTITKSLKVGEKIKGVVSTITSFGIFVSLSIPLNKEEIAVDGLVHISEVSWDKVVNIFDLFVQGTELEAVIIGFDKDAKRLDLSLRQLTVDPFAEAVKKYSIDQKIKGEVSQILSTGVLVKLDSDIEGFIRREKIPPTLSYEVGSLVSATISQIDGKKHRIILDPILKEKPIGYR